MPTSDLNRRIYGRRYVTIPLGQSTAAGVYTLTNIAATATVVAYIPVPDNCLLESVGVAYASSTGTTSALTVGVRRSTTTLVSVAVSGTGATVGLSSDVDAPCSKGEALNLTITGGTNDDDFVGACAVVTFAPLKTNS